MIPLQFTLPENRQLNILCLGAHCDDIEIGCGGTLLNLIERGLVGSIRWIVFASNELRKKEALHSAEIFTKEIPAVAIEVLDYRDAFLSYSALDIKEYFESVSRQFDADIIFTHYRHDRHQDHRLLSELSWNTFRNHCILEYEIPKYDGDLGIPNCFFQISESHAKRKSEILLECYQSQATKHWFDEETFLALMRIRGMEAASSTRYAEAFHARKMIF